MHNINLKTLIYTIIVCLPIGWMWNWYHYKACIIPAWGFTEGNVLGLYILGIPFVDWHFYSVTGTIFASSTILINNKVNRIEIDTRLIENIKVFLFIILIHLTILGVLVFGYSGTATAMCFGVPSIAMFIYVYDNIHVKAFLLSGAVIVPANVLWDIWATPMTKQWYYNKESFMFNNNLWYYGIPFEMTPYLGIMSWFFVYLVVKTIRKRLYGTK